MAVASLNTTDPSGVATTSIVHWGTIEVMLSSRPGSERAILSTTMPCAVVRTHQESVLQGGELATLVVDDADRSGRVRSVVEHRRGQGRVVGDALLVWVAIVVSGSEQVDLVMDDRAVLTGNGECAVGEEREVEGILQADRPDQWRLLADRAGVSLSWR